MLRNAATIVYLAAAAILLTAAASAANHSNPVQFVLLVIAGIGLTTVGVLIARSRAS